MTAMSTARHSPARYVRSGLLLFPLAACAALVAAAPPQTPSPDDLVRQANTLFREGDRDAADKLYTVAEERTADPGLVAFNRGVVLFERKQYREAELHYKRVLEDAACPPERAVKAWYNRGTCLLHLGGSWEAYRRAVACFEHTLDSPVTDDRLRADARHNIELAKLLCTKEREKDENTKKSPNTDVPPEESDQPRPTPEPQAGSTDVSPGTEPTAESGGGAKSAGTQPQPGTAASPIETDQTTAGNNSALEVLADDAKVQPLTEQDARAHLAETAKRIKREQQSLLRTLYGPERTAVRDW